MLETVLILLTEATPFILLGLGVLGAFLLLARMTGRTVAQAVRAA